MSMKIVSFGEVTVDHYLRQNLTFVGGISLNFAVHAKRSGAEQVSLISCVGNGADGALVLETLAREGVDHTYVAVVEGKTAVCPIEVYDNADRVFPPGGYQVNVLRHFQVTDAIVAAINQHDILVSLYQENWPGSLLIELLQRLNFAGKTVVDFGDWSGGRWKEGAMEVLKLVDLAFISGDETTIPTLLPVAEAMAGLVVVTMGAAGSAALTKNGIVYQTAVPVAKPVDSTGCGDAFQAAFTVNYFRDGDIVAALHKGAMQAAQVLSHYGAFE